MPRTPLAATTLPAASFASAHLVLAAAEYETLAPRLSLLLAQLLSCLQPLGTLHVHNVTETSASLNAAITLSGLMLLTNAPLSNELIAQNSDLSFSRYFRVMGLAVLEMTFTVPLTVYDIVLNSTSYPLYKWRGLADLHFRFERIGRVSALTWTKDASVVRIFRVRAWLVIGSALAFFVFFGLTKEACSHYKSVFLYIARRLGIPIPSKGGIASSSPE